MNLFSDIRRMSDDRLLKQAVFGGIMERSNGRERPRTDFS